MPNLAGVDGCPAGWIALVEQIETGRITAHVLERLRDLAASSSPQPLVRVIWRGPTTQI
jgi:hypothetical protein